VVPVGGVVPKLYRMIGIPVYVAVVYAATCTSTDETKKSSSKLLMIFILK